MKKRNQTQCRFSGLRAALMVMICLLVFGIGTATAEKQLTILFTSDIHSYFMPSTTEKNGVVREHGGAGRLMTLVQENTNDHTLLLDAGDFAMGTLLQAGFSTDAYELRLLGRVGYTATTFGNHEFDLAGSGAASMLRAAIASGDPLPQVIVPANMNLTGTLTDEQQDLRDALEEIGAVRWTLREVNGVRVAIFGLLGKDAIKCAPTSGVVWDDPVDAAKKIVKEIGDQAEVIICISHSGTNGDAKTGEDIDLLKQVAGVDVVISGHTHTTYKEAVIAREGTVLGSSGEYLNYLGRMDLTVTDTGTVNVDDYRMIACDGSVSADQETDQVVEQYLAEVSENYLGGTGYEAEQVIAHSDFDLPFHSQRTELSLGSLIADSYLYACRRAGVDDVQIAIVGLGTIRDSINAGDITVAKAFEVCSLGAGSDGSAGHPLVSLWVQGKDLKLIAEMEALIGPMWNSIQMNYSGMAITFDANRIPLDRITSIELVHEDGTKEPIQMEQRYRVVANMYAINMLGSIASVTKGIVKLSPTDAAGNVIDSSLYYDYAIRKQDGTEVKEWIAFCDYLSSFETTDGIPQIPERYAASQGRKVMTEGSLLDIIKNPGLSTCIALGVIILLLIWIVWLIASRKRRRIRREEKRKAKKERKANRK